MKENILNFTQDELAKRLAPLPKFRAKQIFEWIYKKCATSFSQISSLPQELRNRLEEEFSIGVINCVASQQSRDGSVKYLFELGDAKRIESVLLPMKEEVLDENGKLVRHARYTICVSSQVGCRMGCAFCLTGKSGLVRNLSAGEIVEQILWIKRENNIAYERRVNVVYMGMGEPLDNLANVSKAVSILSDNDALAIAPRRQTISTSGLAGQIKKLGELNLGVLLAISLHAVSDELRERLMPVNKAYNIEAVLDAVRAFPVDLRKKVLFEYLLIDGVNDSPKDARRLVKLLHDIPAKVNLILFNPHEGAEFGRPSVEAAEAFQAVLQKSKVSCTIRQSKGLDISAACGQLKERRKSSEHS